MCANILVINNNKSINNQKNQEIINQFTCFVIFSSIVIVVLAYEMCFFLT